MLIPITIKSYLQTRIDLSKTIYNRRIDERAICNEKTGKRFIGIFYQLLNFLR